MKFNLSLTVLMCLSIFAIPLWGCDGCGNDNTNNQTNNTTPDMMDATDDSGSTDMADMPVKVCDAGVIQCSRENTPSIKVCNASGTAFEPASCPEGQVCRNDTCVKVTCVPDSRRCGSDGNGGLIPQVCDKEGKAYSDLAACEEGFRCEEGNCLNRCEIAKQTRSYIGCEYWAVELENHLLYEESDNPLPPDRQPPFAIVLANTSTTYDAEITVYESGDKIAKAIPSRIVGSDVGGPGINFVTVYSEVVDAEGQRLQSIDGEINKIKLPRGTVMTLVMPARRIPFGATSITDVGFKVVSTQPVVAYQFNPLCCNYNFTNDASLLLPVGSLTENYMFMSYAVWAGSTTRLERPYSATLTVMATEPDTEVTLKLAKPKKEGRPYSELMYPSNSDRVVGPDATGKVTVTLQPYEVFNVGGTGKAPVEDLTGTMINANKPIAVFGGHTCAFVPFSRAACDHMESQLFPIETWGNRFVLAPLKLRNPGGPTNTREGTYWKFVARDNNTIIQTKTDLRVSSGKVFPPADEGVLPCEMFSQAPELGVIELDAGQTCEFGTRGELVALATRPIMVGAFLSGQQSVKPDATFGDHAGDPAFFLVPPEEQYRTSYSFLTPKTYFQSYVTVTIQPGFGVTLDGKPLDLKTFDYVEVDGQGVARAHIPLDAGPHQIEAVVPFGIVVYGYDDYVSYAYTGGLNLSKLQEF